MKENRELNCPLVSLKTDQEEMNQEGKRKDLGD